jgi:hypothetical protein
VIAEQQMETMRVEMRLGDFVFQDSSGQWAQWLVESEDRPKKKADGTPVPQRTVEEVRECTRYGRLYVVRRINGKYAVCFRVRCLKGALKVDKTDRVTMLIKGVLIPRGEAMGKTEERSDEAEKNDGA